MPKSKDARNIVIAEDRWKAYQAAAQRDGKKSVGAWLCEAGDAKLPAKVRSKLSKTKKVGRPKKQEDSEGGKVS